MRAGGRWECREKRREYNQRRAAAKLAWQRADYHACPRNYLWHRRRALREQRENVLNELSQLCEEANGLELEP
jgi:hypothetical protein